MDGRVERIDADLAVAAEGDGADVAGDDIVGFDDIDDGSGELLHGVRQRHTVDFGRVDKAGHVLLQTENAGHITADALEDGGAVMDDVGHDVDVGLVPGDELSVVPDVLGGCDWHVRSLLKNRL